MPQITLELRAKLLSDAEPGTGLGTESLNDLVPVNGAGHPFIPATHIKGLARQTWRDIAGVRGWPDWIEGYLFGQPGSDGEPDRDGVILFKDLIAGVDNSRSIGTISRTRISDHGTVAPGSLRSNECIRATTEFTGSVQVKAPSDSLAHHAACLVLLAIDSVGGGRTRGAGRISTTIAHHTDHPSGYLKKVDALARDSREPAPAKVPAPALRQDTSELLVITFTAESPVCCPQSPLASGGNVITGGFYIPASAVQGGLLTALGAIDPSLASDCFASEAFRTWPLLPCHLPDDPANDSIIPFYVSTTHRISKIPDPSTNHHRFNDSVISKYAAGEEPANAPMKGADGVLLAGDSGVLLWRSSEMPRVFAAHVGLGNDEPALFTTQSMAPMVYRGIISVPQSLAGRIREALSEGLPISFGRSRTVRGIGRLRASAPKPDSRTFLDKFAAASGVSAFIVHSPILVTDHSRHEPAGAALKRIVEAAGWGEVVEAHASLSCSFGWNRTASRDLISNTRRLRAAVTIAPGSVFRLSAPIADLHAKLVRGLGGGRDRGFGAVLPHPGVAKELYARPAALKSIRSKDDAGKRAGELIRIAEDSGLTASQISDLLSRLKRGRKNLVDRIDNFHKYASKRAWSRWEPVIEHLRHLSHQSSVSDDCLKRIIKAWHDFTVADGSNSQEWHR